ncbi:hypothetical protein [Curtobacterium sp. MCBD17_030]|uniref:hypothetical protein n=1 Tax=Curtobacterium sp. MCBD17_030 TaxID=2175649 RepID=UPI000D9D3642|nr:hypothetical protein [Curtobacterium sp. MCBD17_030]PYY36417.1 hypothetical protein DEI89_04405 [Curtobacterium sp. MCBD17_030]
MTRVRLGTLVAAALLAAGVVTVTGCSSASSGSRARMYDSVSSMADHSSLVVTGTVRQQRVANDVADADPTTLSTVRIVATAKTDPDHPVGSTVVVRQHGTTRSSGPGMLLEDGGTYLLYLMPSALDGDLADQYFVTGGAAGVYVGEDGRTDFRRGTDEGDELPTHLTLADALRG